MIVSARGESLHPPSIWYNLQIQLDPGLEHRAHWERWPTQTDVTQTLYEDGSTSTYVRQREWVVGEQSHGMLRHKKEHKTDQRDEVTWPHGRQAVFQC